MNSSSSVMAPLFANQSCDPWTPTSRPCLLGNYVDYTVNVSTPGDIIEAMKFAPKKNIRFVPRNIGHEYVTLASYSGKLLTCEQLSGPFNRCRSAIHLDSLVERY